MKVACPSVDQGLGIDGAVEGDLEARGHGRDAIDRDRPALEDPSVRADAPVDLERTSCRRPGWPLKTLKGIGRGWKVPVYGAVAGLIDWVAESEKVVLVKLWPVSLGF